MKNVIKWLRWTKLNTRTKALSRSHAVVSEFPNRTACGLVLPPRLDYWRSPEPVSRCVACDEATR